MKFVGTDSVQAATFAISHLDRGQAIDGGPRLLQNKNRQPQESGEQLHEQRSRGDRLKVVQGLGGKEGVRGKKPREKKRGIDTWKEEKK